VSVINHYTVFGCSHLTTDERTMTATEVKIRLAQFDRQVSKVAEAMQGYVDALMFDLVSRTLPRIAYGRMGRAIRRRKRHSRYRRGRASVRPRHRTTR